MENYKNYIEGLANSDSSDEYLNSSPEHASIVLTTILNHARDYVYFYSGELNNSTVFNQTFLNGLDKFLDRDGKLKILVQKSNINSKIAVLLRYYRLLGKDIEVKKHDNKIFNADTEQEIHFAIADDKMFRVEDNIENYTAFGSFNNTDFVSELKSHFTKINNTATIYDF